MNEKLKLSDSYRQFNSFTQIPNAVISHDDLSCKAKMLYAALARYAFQSSTCWPGQEQLADDLNVSSTRTVRNWMQELDDADLLDVDQQRGTNVYTLYLPSDLDDDAQGDQGAGDPAGNKPGNNFPGRGVNPEKSFRANPEKSFRVHNNNTNKNNKTSTSKRATRAREKSTDGDNDVDDELNPLKKEVENRIGTELDNCAEKVLAKHERRVVLAAAQETGRRDVENPCAYFTQVVKDYAGANNGGGRSYPCDLVDPRGPAECTCYEEQDELEPFQFEGERYTVGEKRTHSGTHQAHVPHFR